MEKKWYLSKTIIYGVVHILVAAATKVFGWNLSDIAEKLGDNAFEIVTLAEGAIIMILRAVTKKPLNVPGNATSISIVILVGLLLMLSGCNRINADAKYTNLIQQTTAQQNAIADMANQEDDCGQFDCVGKLTIPQAKEALQQSADRWTDIESALKGEPSPE